MRTICARFVSWVGVLALVSVLVPGALAQCALGKKAVKPAAWQFYSGGPHNLLVSGVPNDDDGRDDPIVGMWHVTFTADTMNGSPFSGVIDNSIVVWHSDGTEIMNSSRPAQDGNFCMGVWTRTARSKYLLNHIAWQGNDPENAPSGIGNPQAGVQIVEKITLSANGQSYTGSFTLNSYDASGHLAVSFTGSISAKRITPHTPFTDLL